MEMLSSAIEQIAGVFLEEATSSPSMFEDLAAMERYMAESYSGRTFIEILQNADDAHAKRVLVFACGQDVVIANDGRAFDENDLAAICRSGASSKRKGLSIGYRGVGFKSATEISTEIIIYSADTWFTFSKARCAKILGKATDNVPTVRIPFLVDKDELSAELCRAINQYEQQGYNTFFVFRDPNFRKLFDELTKVSSSWMLFLRNVETIKLRVPPLKVTHHISRKRTEAHDEIVTFSDTGEKWIVVTGGSDLSLAFKLDADGKIVPCSAEDARFHCFLPTLDPVGFSFKVNADFSTDPSRKHVIFDETTRANLSALAKLVAAFVSRSCTNTEQLSILPLLCTRVGFSELSSKFDLCIQEELQGRHWFPLNGGIAVNPSSIKIIPDWFDSESRKIVCANIPALKNSEISNLLLKSIDNINSVLKKFGAQDFELNDYLSILQSVDIVATLDRTFFGKLWGYSYRESHYSYEAFKRSYVFDVAGRLIYISDIDQPPQLDVEFAKGLTGVLNKEELNKLADSFIAFETLKQSSPKKHVSDSIRKAQIVKRGLTSLNKWKTPIENCIASETLLGNQAQDVSRKNLGYDIVSVDGGGNNRYIVVKQVGAIGDSFVLTDAEYCASQRLEQSFFIYLIAENNPEDQNVLVKPSSCHGFEKRVKEWEWLCSSYEAEKKLTSNDNNALDAKFIQNISLSSFNNTQKAFLLAVYKKEDLAVFPKQYHCTPQTLTAQINGIVDFYLGEALLEEKDGTIAVCDKYLGSIAHLLNSH